MCPGESDPNPRPDLNGGGAAGRARAGRVRAKRCSGLWYINVSHHMYIMYIHKTVQDCFIIIEYILCIHIKTKNAPKTCIACIACCIACVLLVDVYACLAYTVRRRGRTRPARL